MAKRIRLSASSADSWETDWTKCCLCQEVTTDLLKSSDEGYAMLGKNIPLFHELNALPIPLDIRRLNHGEGIESTMKKENAKYNNLCRIKFNNTKLERAQKRNMSPIPSGSSSDCTSSKLFRCTPRSKDQQQNPVENVHKCFICDKVSPLSVLREAMTMKLNQRLVDCATALQDKQLLAKLSSGDVIAQEMKYHPSCLAAVYNRERSKKRQTEIESSCTQEETIMKETALAELVTYIFETQRNSEESVVFRLADLANLYEERLAQLGSSSEQVHSTRLKDKLLQKMPELEAHTKGRDVLLMFEKDIGPAIAFACDYNDTMHMAKTAEMIRCQLATTKTTFSGSLVSADIDDSIPPPLLQLVEMIEHGPDIKSQLENVSTKSDLALAQLLMFNYHPNSQKVTVQQRHSADRETPFCVYLGLLLFAKTRKRQLIDTLFQHGLCISYDRVLEISTQLGEAVVERYLNEGVVCPPFLKGKVFTTAAVDNIDHNPSSTTSKSSFHGTGISIFQHPMKDNIGVRRDELILPTHKPKSKKVPELPAAYMNMKPAYLKTKPEPLILPDDITNILNHDYLFMSLQNEYEWLNTVRLTGENLTSENISWSSFHSSERRGPTVEVSLSCLMPLFQEQAHSVATIKHSMDKVRDVVSFLNPGQTPVITADQPLFVLAKQIQWEWPNEYGENKFVVMFGGLHIEMACFKVLGDLLRDSGWIEALSEADVASSGTAESFLSSSNTPKTRLAHQVTACVLFDLLMSAYESSINEDPNESIEFDNFIQWCEERKVGRPHFEFWYSVLEFQLLVFSYIRSLREADFELYKQTLSSLIPYFFGLDHINYARWLPIHLRDMASLETKTPDIYREFIKGHFTVKKSNRVFSNMAIDQAHEQNNAIVKGDGGAVGLTEDPAALRRWMVAGPEISRLISQFEEYSSRRKNTDDRHHDNSMSMQKDFIDKVRSLKTVMNDYGNPFLEDSEDIYKIDSKDIVQAGTGKLSQIKQAGCNQYADFRNRMQNTASIYEPIKKNKFLLFSRQPKKSSCETKSKLDLAREDCSLFSRLFISCQSRQCDLEEFFSHENQKFPPSLSQSGKINIGVKSQLMEILEAKGNLPREEPVTDMVVVDGAAMVNSRPPRGTYTFDEYAKDVILPYIIHLASKHARVDVIYDIYIENSLKAQTRKARGAGSRRKVVGTSKTPKAWSSFLRVDENKTELFYFLADKICSIQSDKIIFVTKGEIVMTNSNDDHDDLSPCNHEEADTRIFVHIKSAAEKGCKSSLIISSDTDVVVLAVSLFKTLQIEKLWVAFGKGKDLRWLPIHEINHALGPKSEALPFFHAFTGCDTVSAFRGKGKKSTWQTWEIFDDVTEVFERLSKKPELVSDADMELIEAFVVVMYDRTTTTFDINESRLELFARKQRQYDTIPPTKAALLEHTKRATYQGGHVWGQAVIHDQHLPSPGDWGWVKENADGMWIPHWTQLAAIAASCQELHKCGCKKTCSGRCKCYKAGLTCTTLCSCSC